MVDPAAKTNLTLFGGAMLALAAFWLLLAGLTGAGPLQVVAGIACAIGSFVVFRAYARGRNKG